MKAVVVLNKMPQNCRECPFKWEAYDENCDNFNVCNVLVYNNNDHTSFYEHMKKRRENCPLWEMEDHKTVIQIEEERLKV